MFTVKIPCKDFETAWCWGYSAWGSPCWAWQFWWHTPRKTVSHPVTNRFSHQPVWATEIRVSMTTVFDGVVTPLKIDISTGDAITPREVRYSFKLMLEDRSIDIWAYNLETMLAEKLETIITRETTNTRMRDFYDIYILEQLQGNTLNAEILHDAMLATARKRETEVHLTEAKEVFDEVEDSPAMQQLWIAYRKKLSYAADLEWNIVMKAVRKLYSLAEEG